jgi:hypothetical protein
MITSMAKTYRGTTTRLANFFVKALVHTGFGANSTYLLTARGRKSGRPRTPGDANQGGGTALAGRPLRRGQLGTQCQGCGQGHTISWWALPAGVRHPTGT